tara:strand:- start:86 stop:595 length:510 start_codon:yes stop_codon:yes gene_type:complete
VRNHTPEPATETASPDTKRSISLRMNQSDYDRIRTIAKRMRTRESDVFRFLLRLALAQVAPLDNGRNAGAELLPAFVNFPVELANHFELDAERIQRVINDGADPENAVDEHDIELLAMAGQSHRYLALRISELTGEDIGADDVLPAMRRYLERKYRHRPDTRDPDGDAR